MTGEQQQALFDNTARAIKGAREETAERHIAHFGKVDPAHGQDVPKACEASGALRATSAAASVSANRSSAIEA